MSTSTLLSLIPEDAWDSHMHVFSPEALSPEQQRRSAYVPPEATVPQALGVLGRLGQGQGQGQGQETGTGAEAETGKGKSLRMCIVQPSIYGVDNTVTLSGVGELNVHRARQGSSSGVGSGIGPGSVSGPGSGTGTGENVIDGISGGCAVVELDPDDCPKEVLEGMYKRGSRGVRLNLKSRAQTLSPSDLRAKLGRYAALIKPYGWVLQVYLGMGMLKGLDAGFVKSLGVPLVLDHFAHPDLPVEDGSKPLDLKNDVEGYRSLLDLYSAPDSPLYIKISGWYRITPPGSSGRADDPSLKRIFFDLAQIDPTRLVWGSDWPHTRFEGIDTVEWASVVVGWCEELAALQQMEDQEQRRMNCWDGQAGRSTERVVRERAGELVRMLFKGNADELWLGRDKE